MNYVKQVDAHVETLESLNEKHNTIEQLCDKLQELHDAHNAHNREGVSRDYVTEKIQAHGEGLLQQHKVLEQKCDELRRSILAVGDGTDKDAPPVVSLNELERKIAVQEEAWTERHKQLQMRHDELHELHGAMDKNLSVHSGIRKEIDSWMNDYARKSDELNVRLTKSEENLLSKLKDVKAADRNGSSDSALQLAALVNAVQRDEEEESSAYQRLVARVDEICDRLSAVANIVAVSGKTSDGNAEVTTQLKLLADKMEASHNHSAAVQAEMQAKVQILADRISG